MTFGKDHKKLQWINYQLKAECGSRGFFCCVWIGSYLLHCTGRESRESVRPGLHCDSPRAPHKVELTIKAATPSKVRPRSGHGWERMRPWNVGWGHMGECFPKWWLSRFPWTSEPAQAAVSCLLRANVCPLLRTLQSLLLYETHVPPSGPASTSLLASRPITLVKSQHKPAWHCWALKGGRRPHPKKLQDLVGRYQQELGSPREIGGHFQGSQNIRLNKAKLSEQFRESELFPPVNLLRV